MQYGFVFGVRNFFVQFYEINKRSESIPTEFQHEMFTLNISKIEKNKKKCTKFCVTNWKGMYIYCTVYVMIVCKVLHNIYLPITYFFTNKGQL